MMAIMTILTINDNNDTNDNNNNDNHDNMCDVLDQRRRPELPELPLFAVVCFVPDWCLSFCLYCYVFVWLFCVVIICLCFCLYCILLVALCCCYMFVFLCIWCIRSYVVLFFVPVGCLRVDDAWVSSLFVWFLCLSGVCYIVACEMFVMCFVVSCCYCSCLRLWFSLFCLAPVVCFVGC